MRTREGLERSPSPRARARSSEGHAARGAPRADSVAGFMAMSSLFIAPRGRLREAAVRSDGYAAIGDGLEEEGAALAVGAAANTFGLTCVRACVLAWRPRAHARSRSRPQAAVSSAMRRALRARASNARLTARGCQW